jgi:hypothetical protein
MKSYSAARRVPSSRFTIPLLTLLLAGAAHAASPDLTPIAGQSVREGAFLSISLGATDPDGDSIIFSTSGLPPFCLLDDNGDGTGSIDCSPGANDAGNSNITVTATDDSVAAESSSDNFVLTVEANTVPNIGNIGNQSMAEGESLTIPASATDGDGDGLSFSSSGLPGFCSLTDNNNGTADIECNPGGGAAGTYNPITIIVTDDAPIPLSDSDPFSLTVTANTAPVLTPIANQAVAEGASLNISLNATDANGDNLAFSQTDLPGFCSLTDNGNGTGSISCNPGAGTGGSYPITVTVTDDAPVPGSDSDPFTLSVTANSAPVLTPIANQSVAEGSSLNIPLSATDPNGDGLSFSQSGLPGFCSLTDNGNGTGSISCNPGAGTGGSYPITITVTDNAPIPLNNSDNFTLSVSTNTPPVLSPIANQSVQEGESLNIPLSATDGDGDGLAFSQTGLPGFCSLTDNGNGTGSIACNPAVGDEGVYPVTVTVTDDGPVPAQASDPFSLTVNANQPPAATNVSISGDPTVRSVLTGNYVYTDAENDLEGASTFRWLRDGVAITGATSRTYTVVVADVETALRFEVTPVAASGATPGTPAQSGPLVVSNTAPSITGQNPIEIAEDTSREIVLDDLIVSDLDSDFPDDFTLSVRNGANYTRSGANGNTITPNLDFNGNLTVPVTVNDGFVDSPVFNLVVTVTPVNDAPTFGGVVPQEPNVEPPCNAIDAGKLCTPEDTTLTIVITDLVVDDPDIPDQNIFPDDFTLTLDPVVPPDANYTLAGPASVTPAENFNGDISVRATVSDAELSSTTFLIPVQVDAVNDAPSSTPIDSQNAIEDSEFTLDVSEFFDDADNDTLAYTATFDPPIPPERNISFDGATGQFSGAPFFNDDDPDDPVYLVTITAEDGESFTEETFDLTISQLGRANLGLEITVSPETVSPSEELRWTFTTNNPIGPSPGESVELTGRFIGDGLTVSVVGGASCTVNTQAGQVDFTCAVGALPIGQTVPVQLSTTASQATEVVAFATSAGTEPVPIDPNPNNNSAVRAIGVADSFSLGAVQYLGDAAIVSMAAGDVNDDGALDIIVGTESGRPVQIYLGAEPRESCGCQRDFEAAPLTVPDTGSNRGVALADFDNNGALDLVIVNNGGQPDTVYANDGAGNFSLAATLAPSNGRDVAVGDFNNDGNLDIAVAAGSPNPVYFGDGTGGFSDPPVLLGDETSSGVAVGRFNADNLDDLVFANIGAESRVWTATAGGGFAEAILPTATVGDAASVAAADLNNDGLDDLVFGRVPADITDIPSNPVLTNQGNATFGAALAELGISPTNDVLIGDVSDDGILDIVFVNASGLHQTWVADGAGYTLHGEQIIDIDARVGVLANLGFADTDDPGGIDLALGGAIDAGAAVYLNDSIGNLGLGDSVVPVITLNGAASVDVPSGNAYTDAGAAAVDNIDGDITASIVVNNTVNTAAVGSYTVTYNVRDFAGNAAVQVTRTVNVTAAVGRGGGGGGALDYWVVAILAVTWLLLLLRPGDELRPRIVISKKP